jgi:hypothetical protein
MLECLAVSAVWAIAIPPCSLTARSPSVPSLPLPESRMQMASSPWSSANERKNSSIGVRTPRVFSIGLVRRRLPRWIWSRAFGGIT